MVSDDKANGCGDDSQGIEELLSQDSSHGDGSLDTGSASSSPNTRSGTVMVVFLHDLVNI